MSRLSAATRNGSDPVCVRPPRSVTVCRGCGGAAARVRHGRPRPFLSALIRHTLPSTRSEFHSGVSPVVTASKSWRSPRVRLCIGCLSVASALASHVFRSCLFFLPHHRGEGAHALSNLLQLRTPAQQLLQPHLLLGFQPAGRAGDRSGGLADGQRLGHRGCGPPAGPERLEVAGCVRCPGSPARGSPRTAGPRPCIPRSTTGAGRPGRGGGGWPGVRRRRAGPPGSGRARSGGRSCGRNPGHRRSPRYPVPLSGRAWTAACRFRL
ncbi:hypothetical protein ABH917_000848 [Thermobifida halotolerans]